MIRNFKKRNKFASFVNKLWTKSKLIESIEECTLIWERARKFFEVD